MELGVFPVVHDLPKCALPMPPKAKTCKANQINKMTLTSEAARTMQLTDLHESTKQAYLIAARPQEPEVILAPIYELDCWESSVAIDGRDARYHPFTQQNHAIYCLYTDYNQRLVYPEVDVDRFVAKHFAAIARYVNAKESAFDATAFRKYMSIILLESEGKPSADYAGPSKVFVQWQE